MYVTRHFLTYTQRNRLVEGVRPSSIGWQSVYGSFSLVHCMIVYFTKQCRDSYTDRSAWAPGEPNVAWSILAFAARSLATLTAAVTSRAAFATRNDAALSDLCALNKILKCECKHFLSDEYYFVAVVRPLLSRSRQRAIE
jgi:hypothetical protein